MNTESWCTVESRSSENWTRSNRKHFGKAFESKVFKEGPDDSEGRLQFPQKKEVHRERRHFPEKCKFVFSSKTYWIFKFTTVGCETWFLSRI